MTCKNAVFEEDGMKMLEQWEKESTLMLAGGRKSESTTLDLNAPRAERAYVEREKKNNDYDQFFEEEK